MCALQCQYGCWASTSTILLCPVCACVTCWKKCWPRIFWGRLAGWQIGWDHKPDDHAAPPLRNQDLQLWWPELHTGRKLKVNEVIFTISEATLPNCQPFWCKTMFNRHFKPTRRIWNLSITEIQICIIFMTNFWSDLLLYIDALHDTVLRCTLIVFMQNEDLNMCLQKNPHQTLY